MPAVAAMLARILITPGLTPDAVAAILTGTRAATTHAGVADPRAGACTILRDALRGFHGGKGMPTDHDWAVRQPRRGRPTNRVQITPGNFQTRSPAKWPQLRR